LPPQSLLKAKVRKKNKNLGWETRYIALGLTQLLITRDENYVRVLNIVPLLPGTFIINRRLDHITLKTSEREFILEFETIGESEQWFLHILQLTGHDLVSFIADTDKIKKYQDVTEDMREHIDVQTQVIDTFVNLAPRIYKLRQKKDSLDKKLNTRIEYQQYKDCVLDSINFEGNQPDLMLSESIEALNEVKLTFYV